MATQSDYRYTISVSVENGFEVVSFALEEGLWQPFYLSLSLACSVVDVEFAMLKSLISSLQTIIGQESTVFNTMRRTFILSTACWPKTAHTFILSTPGTAIPCT